MPRGRQLSIEEKTKIMCWGGEGIKAKEIASRLGRTERAIYVHLRALKELPPKATPPPPRGRSGRPSKTTTIQDIRLKNYVQKNPFKSARQLKNEVPGWGDISVRTIQHRLQKKLGLPSRRAAKKPLLTEAMKRKRLAFARKYRNWTSYEWRNVMFSDESTFSLVNSRSVTVRRSKTMCRYKHKFVVKTVKHSANVMVWGCFSGKMGRGGLYFLPKNCTMNGERYKKVLEDHLLPFMRIHKTTFFLQDGAPCHKSKLVMAFLKQSEKEFKIIDWPGNSPDLNPIENCWSYMKRKLKANTDITSLPKLVEAIKLMWVEDMAIPYFKKLADSMPKRLQMVVDAKGELTKY
jgi:transposase